MGKVTDLGSVPADDPMFSGGPSLFSNEQFKRHSKSSGSATGVATPASQATPPAASAAPQRSAFKTDEEFEEAQSRWR